MLKISKPRLWSLGCMIWSLLQASIVSAADLSPLIVKAKEEKEVVWYTTASAADNQAIVAGFTRKYPFLRAQALRQTGEKLRQRILTEASAGQFFSDVVSVSGLEMSLLKSKNLLQPYAPSEAEIFPSGGEDKKGKFSTDLRRDFVLRIKNPMNPRGES